MYDQRSDILDALNHRLANCNKIKSREYKALYAYLKRYTHNEQSIPYADTPTTFLMDQAKHKLSHMRGCRLVYKTRDI